MQGELVILGGGESGVGAALLAQNKGFKVFVSDRGTIQEKRQKVLLQAGIEFEQGQHDEARILNANEVIKSPGIPDKAPLIVALREKGISIIDELEFAARYTQGKLIGITGTNGKTTTTSLIYHVLSKAGLKVGLGGNIGKSMAAQLVDGDFDYWVLEVSSFQLDGMHETRFNIAILLNITEDHLDRYNYEFQNYIDSKFRIIQNQTADDHFIFWADDPIIQREMEKRNIPAQKHGFSLESPQPEGAYLKEDQIRFKIKEEELFMSVHELAIQGRHNANNTMASGITARVLDIRKEIIRDSLSDFQNVEHRLEYVTKISGVEYINDSKATNVNSTWYALESMTEPTIWIVGGVDKGNDYTQLYDLVKDKVKTIIALGKDNSKILNGLGVLGKEMYEATSMIEAVAIAYRIAEKGDNVLLSPACASFDLFESYEDRGNQFKDAVRSL